MGLPGVLTSGFVPLVLCGFVLASLLLLSHRHVNSTALTPFRVRGSLMFCFCTLASVNKKRLFVSVCVYSYPFVSNF